MGGVGGPQPWNISLFCTSFLILDPFYYLIRNIFLEVSLSVQCLRLCASTAGDMNSIAGQGTEIPQAVQHSQKNFYSEQEKLFYRLWNKHFAILPNLSTQLSTYSIQFSSVQSLSHVQLFATPWTAAHQASLSITNSQSLLKLMFIESVMPSSHLILCRPLLLLPSIFPSIRVFSNESALPIRWLKYWSFSFSISPSNEYSGLISFRMDWLDLLAVQGTLKSLFQHHRSKASILQHSAFFIVQLSHPYMMTGKTIALTRWTFVGKVLSLLLMDTIVSILIK